MIEKLVGKYVEFYDESDEVKVSGKLISVDDVDIELEPHIFHWEDENECNEYQCFLSIPSDIKEISENEFIKNFNI